MKIQSLTGGNIARPNGASFSTKNTDTVSFQALQSNQSQFITGDGYSIHKNNNVTRIISFKGAGKPEGDKDDLQLDHPKFKMKVGAVSQFQDNIAEINEKDLKKHPRVNFEFDEDRHDIKLFYEKTQKQIGFIDFDILDHLYDYIQKDPDDYELELTNIIKVPNGVNTGLRVRINYVGQDKEKMQGVFDNVLEDPRCAPIVYPPCVAQSPESILKTILKYEEQLNGSKSKENMELAINNIADEIKSEKNKNILLLGHREPDGDALACVLGMKNAIELMDVGKKVDCAVDDNIPMLFSFIPGIGEIKRPEDPMFLSSLDKGINNPSVRGNQNPSVLGKIKDYVSNNVDFIKKDQKYDLVILMDVASPSRLGNKYAKHIDPDKTKIIFIDHHPKRFKEWEDSKKDTNIDVKRADREHLAWVADRVPAAAIMVSGVAGRLYPKLNDENVYNEATPKEQEKLKNMATAILTGVHTDTSSYSRSSNLYTDDMKLPRYERPRYNPMGVAKWFSLATGRSITRNYIEGNLELQDIKMRPVKDFAKKTLPSKCHRDDTLQLNYMKIEKEYLDELWMEAAKNHPEVTSKDILGLVKYSLAFNHLKRADARGKNRKDLQDDTIAYLMTQTAKKGELGPSCKISETDNISYSFRSKNGTSHAAILASLFNGGGHGAAAGGRISGDNINFDTKLLVLVDGQVENNPEIILKTLNKNFELEHSAMRECEKMKLLKEVKVIKSPNQEDGRTSTELITSIVGKIRENQKADNMAMAMATL